MTKKRRSSNRGFTLLELTVVLTLIVMFAVAVAPTVRSQQRGSAVRSFYLGARRIVSAAREAAVSDKTTVYLTYDDGQRRLVLSRDQADSDQRQEFSTVALPSEVEATSFKAGSEEANSSDWSIAFYADGTSDGGGVSFGSGGGARGLSISTTGYGKLIEGELPDPSTERWEAGSYEQRL